MNFIKRIGLSAAAGGAIFLALMYWYQWNASPLTDAEVDDYMNRIEAQTQSPGGRHDLPALRKFLSQDDGRPIYTVNLYEFRDVADYPAALDLTGSGEDAYERFSSVMIKLMVVRGSHPIFGSSWSDKVNGNWDRIVIVRYRSRRDLVDLFAAQEFADASLHKWASIKKHDRMLVQALHIPGGEVLIFILALIVTSIVFAFRLKGGSFWGDQFQ
ncbi:hypothetical protein [Sphingorhabdus sp. Alg231-15]|uniref:hypothetical protein n=1 Tax=Sphingorhabdus sp. Alg231-15 TaxID=1922222 RepID=UPI000D560053